MHRLLNPLIAAMALAAGAACAATPATEVVHFWESGSEKAALGVVRQAFEAQGGVWKDRPTASNDASRKLVLARIVAGYPPAAMQWHAGSDLRDIVELGAVLDIDDIARQGQWAKVLPRVVNERIGHQGKVYLAPIGLHAENWLWTNTKVLAEQGLSAPATWAEFLAMAPRLEQRGIVPLAVGGDDWEIELVFNAVLVSTVGKDAFRRLLISSDASVLRSPGGVEAFRLLGEIRRHAGKNDRKRRWSDATAEVIAGRAAMQVMGDWAKGEFLKAGMTPGQQFGCQMAPGNSDVYMLIVDAFAFPRLDDPQKRRWQEQLAKTLLDPAVQVRFSQIKGSIPVRADVDPAQFDACARLGMKVVAEPANQLLPPSMQLQFNLRVGMESVVGRYFRDGKMTPQQGVDALAAVFERRSGPPVAVR